ncbi:hypothetical protein HYY74_06835 [Candidatus Woesearchaeota archaeon]|nr:hypothetical protein [Candidatus Woesearchaeota archaeon]
MAPDPTYNLLARENSPPQRTSITMRWPDFLKPKAEVPAIFILFVVLYQFYELIVRYNISLEARVLAYFLIVTFAYLFRVIELKPAIFISLLSLGIPYLWLQVSKLPQGDFTLLLNMSLLMLAPVWAWVFIKSYIPKSFFGELLRVCLVLLLVFGIIYPQLSLVLERLGLAETRVQAGPQDSLGTLIGGLQKTGRAIVNLPVTVQKAWDNYINSATQAFYPGKEESGSAISLSITELKTADQEYREGQDVLLLATVKAANLDRTRPISASPRCWSDREKTDETEGQAQPEAFEILGSETIVFDCRLKGLKRGTHPIKAAAQFRFTTQAELLSYFMKKETLKSLGRDGLDPLRLYDAPDPKPVAVHTPGPVMIGISAPEPPIGLEDASRMSLGITISNRWSGRIEDIEEVVITLPRGIELYETEGCTHKFIHAGEDSSGNSLYSLDIAAEREDDSEKFTKIDKYQSFRCSLLVTDNTLLLAGKPFAIRNFKVNARYVYSVEKDLSLDLKEKRKVPEKAGSEPPAQPPEEAAPVEEGSAGEGSSEAGEAVPEVSP